MSDLNNFPEYLTHYYMEGDKPFRSITDLGDEDAKQILQKLNLRHDEGKTLGSFPDDYLDKRRVVEKELYEKFIKKGGVTTRRHPYYLWWDGKTIPEQFELKDYTSIKIKLSDFPKESLSFTYPDSMGSINASKNPDLAKPYHGIVFTYDEILEFFKTNEFPTGGWEKFGKVYFAKAIEVQLWTDKPIIDYLENK
ncbi:MAG: hypothetical protein COA79_14330 [Planctomycetota bacterium]|nr:MAG: hypothetical protein COA79_14330 [Planctomycetota bacterium]